MNFIYELYLRATELKNLTSSTIRERGYGICYVEGKLEKWKPVFGEWGNRYVSKLAWISNFLYVAVRKCYDSMYLKELCHEINSFWGLMPPISLSQIRKFPRWASPQIAKPQLFIINPQIANSQISTKYCATLFQISPENRLFQRFLSYKIWIREVCAIFLWRKNSYLRTCGRFKSANYKKSFGLQIANPQSVTFAERQQI
jgi:hypothetical protein